MKFNRYFTWKLFFAVALMLLSASLYSAHVIIFRDKYHLLYYLLNDIAFLPLEVLIVSFILHKLLQVRERKAMLNKMNMVIGTFFSETGTDLLRSISCVYDPRVNELRRHLKVLKTETDKYYNIVRKRIRAYDHDIDISKGKLDDLKCFLISKRAFLLGLLENPNLLEHDGFTDLLWAVFHLTEELAMRKRLSELPDSDLIHLSGDVKRVYSHLTLEWLDYMHHLKRSYPYIYSLALRTNPFDIDASPVVS
jgi:hypothetical protein